MAIISRAEINTKIWEKSTVDAAENAKNELNELIELIKVLKVKELSRTEDRAIAPVASDGGECRLIAEPFGFDIIRVADSEGTIYAEHVISLSEEPYVAAKKLYEESELLQDFCKRIDVKWEELSFLIPGRETTEESNITTQDMLPVIRDILEWAALVDLAAKARPFKVLLLKDGALRTRNLTKYAVPKLREYLKGRYKADGTLVAGISKKSILLNKLYLAIRSLNLLNRESPCYTEIPDNILEKIYKWKTYIKEQSFAITTIAKLASGKTAFYVVDLADYMDINDIKKSLEILSAHSQTTFPQIGYPTQLVRAHNYASISNIDNSYIGRLLKNKLIDTVGSEIANTLMSEMFLNKGFKAGGIR